MLEQKEYRRVCFYEVGSDFRIARRFGFRRGSAGRERWTGCRMPPPSPSDAPSQADDAALFDALAAALSATARGRWFLEEYVRRHRSADIARLLDSVSRLEKSAPASPAGREPANPSLVSSQLAGEARTLAAVIREAASLQMAANRRLEALLQRLDAFRPDPEMAAAPAPAPQADSRSEPSPAPPEPPSLDLDSDLFLAEAVPPPGQAHGAGAEAIAGAPASKPDPSGAHQRGANPLGPLMALSEAERLALFS